MLKITGNGSITTCDGITRRDFLQVGTLGALGFSLSQLAQLQAVGAVAQKPSDKACILIFNLGAPSQLDTWDMKPDAPREIRGPFKPIRTNNPDIQISEIFPLHAKHADKFSLVRTCYHTAAAVHDTGHQMMQTGRLFQGGINTPTRAVRWNSFVAAKPNCRLTSSCPNRWGPLAATCPTDRTLVFWEKTTTRSCSTPIRAIRISKSQTCSRLITSPLCA